ncbi:hypothetical protein D3C87_600090 [compost metagenome]
MKKSLPVLGVALALLVSLGVGCAGDDDFFAGGKGGKGGSTGSNDNPTPTPTPSGDIHGGIK